MFDLAVFWKRCDVERKGNALVSMIEGKRKKGAAIGGAGEHVTVALRLLDGA